MNVKKLKIGVAQNYFIECFDKDGNLKWTDGFKNIVTTVGLNQYLDATLKTGVTSPTWFVGLKDATAVVAGDTMLTNGFTELVPYSNATRPAFTPGTIAGGSVDNSASKAVFNINANATIDGAFIVDDNTKSGTAGILLGGGEFGVSRPVISGDTLNVQATISMTSS